MDGGASLDRKDGARKRDMRRGRERRRGMASSVGEAGRKSFGGIFSEYGGKAMVGEGAWD